MGDPLNREVLKLARYNLGHNKFCSIKDFFLFFNEGSKLLSLMQGKKEVTGYPAGQVPSKGTGCITLLRVKTDELQDTKSSQQHNDQNKAANQVL